MYVRKDGYRYKFEHIIIAEKALGKEDIPMTEIVAEISGNHGGSLENACRLIAEAKKAGADTVKFQCFEPERLALKRASNPYVRELAGGHPLFELYRRMHTPKTWFKALRECAYRHDIPWFSSVFDPADVAFLETMGCPRYKISAFEMLDGDLINAVVATGKPIVMSIRPMPGLTILRASPYGAKAAEALGLSDHSVEGSPFAAFHPTIERHICLPDVETPDTEFSSTPEQFADYVKSIRGIS
jgi:sialic acid synthase SpsE